MNRFLKTFLAFILSVAFVLPLNAFAAEGTTPPTTTPADSSSDYIITYTTDKSSIKANGSFYLTVKVRPQNTITDYSGLKLVHLDDRFSTGQTDYDFNPVGGQDGTGGSQALKSYEAVVKNCKWNGGDNNFAFAIVNGTSVDYKTLTITQCVGASSEPTDPGTTDTPKFSVSVTPGSTIKAGESGIVHFELKNYGREVADDVMVNVHPSEDVLIEGESVFQLFDIGAYGGSAYIDVAVKAVGSVNSNTQTFTLDVSYGYGDGQSGYETLSVLVGSEISSTDKSRPIITAECDLTEKMLAPDTEYSGTLTLRNVGTFKISGASVSFEDGESFIMTGNTGLRYIEEMKACDVTTVPIKIKTLSTFSAVKQPLNMKLTYSYAAANGVQEAEFTRSFIMLAPEQNTSKAIPVVTISKLDKPVTTGNKYTQEVTIDNKGGTDMENVSVVFRGSESIVVSSDTANAFIENIPAGKQEKLKVTYTTAAEFTAASQSITASLSYSGDQTAETVLPIDAKITPAGDAPVVRMTGSGLSAAVVANTTYDYTLTFTNYGKTDVRDIYAELVGSDSIVMTDGTDFVHVSSIKAGKSANVKVRFKTTDPIGGAKQSISAKITFNYGSTAVSKQGTGESSVEIIAAAPSESGSTAAVPNIIIGSYDIGAEQIAAGESFKLNLDFYNTNSETPIENLIMTVSTGEGLNIGNGVNTYFYPNLAAGGKVSQPIDLKALTNAETGVSQVSLNFKYDYISNGTRSTSESTQALFIPIYQPDKMSFEVALPKYEVYPGNETYITTTYLNRGRSTISNVKAEIVGEVEALSTSKVIGNVEAGKNGSFDFVITPSMAGECSFTIKITYEDATYTEVTKELPVKFDVLDMGDMFPGGDIGFDDPGMMIPEEEGKKFPIALIFVIIGVVVAGAVVAIILIVKHKKKKNKPLKEEDIEWEDDLEDILTNGTSNSSNNNPANKV